MADVSSVGAKLEDTICYAIFRLVFVTSLRCAPASDVYLCSILTLKQLPISHPEK